MALCVCDFVCIESLKAGGCEVVVLWYVYFLCY